MKPETRRCAATAAAVLVLWARPAPALTDEEIFRDFSLAVPEPGARALALGGAFTGLADDATAAWSNPAGLTRLRRLEVSTVFRAARLDDTRFAFTSPAFEQFTPKDRSLFAGSVTLGAATGPRDTFRPAFLAVAVPVGRWAVAFSRQELLVADAFTGNEAILTGTRTTFDENGLPVLMEAVDEGLVAEGRLAATIASYNVSAAVELHAKVSLGLTLSLADADVSASVVNLYEDRTAPTPQAVLAYRTRIEDSDGGLTGSAGILVRPVESLGIGLVYRRGARLAVEETVERQGFFADRAIATLGSSFETTFPMPDAYGAGLSWRPLDRLTVLADAVRVEYGDLAEGFVAGANALSNFNPDLEFTADDATVFRGGIEVLAVPGGVPLAFRAGAYTDPDDRLRLDPRSAEEESGLAEVFPGREDEVHLTAGVGATFAEQFQVDLAVDRSDLGTAVVVSAVFRVK